MNRLLESRMCQEAVLLKATTLLDHMSSSLELQPGLHEEANSRSEAAGRLARKHEGQGYKVIKLNFQNFLQEIRGRKSARKSEV